MKRFLVLQSFFVGAGLDRQDLKEPVIDFDFKSEADEWVNNQPDPTLFEIEDQFPEDDEPLIEQHDFDYYDSCSPAYGFYDEDFSDDLIDDEGEQDYPDFDGDGDAD